MLGFGLPNRAKTAPPQQEPPTMVRRLLEERMAQVSAELGAKVPAPARALLTSSLKSAKTETLNHIALGVLQFADELRAALVADGVLSPGPQGEPSSD